MNINATDLGRVNNLKNSIVNNGKPRTIWDKYNDRDNNNSNDNSNIISFGYTDIFNPVQKNKIDFNA